MHTCPDYRLPPPILPLFGITEDAQVGWAIVGPPNPPFDQRQIPVSTKRMNPSGIRRIYAMYVFEIMLHSESLGFASQILAEYFTASSIGTPPAYAAWTNNHWLSALWDIRQHLGTDFADRALAYGAIWQAPSHPDREVDFRNRLIAGVLVVKNNEDQVLTVNKILGAHSLLH